MSTDDQEPEDRRRHARVRFQANARLSSDTVYWPCQLIDVSIKGALLTRPEGWQGGAGDRSLLEITLGDGPPVEMEVNLVRVEADRVACDWDMFDVRGIMQLRRMLEHQLGDPERVAREFERLEQGDLGQSPY